MSLIPLDPLVVVLTATFIVGKNQIVMSATGPLPVIVKDQSRDITFQRVTKMGGLNFQLVGKFEPVTTPGAAGTSITKSSDPLPFEVGDGLARYKNVKVTVGILKSTDSQDVWVPLQIVDPSAVPASPAVPVPQAQLYTARAIPSGAKIFPAINVPMPATMGGNLLDVRISAPFGANVLVDGFVESGSQSNLQVYGSGKNAASAYWHLQWMEGPNKLTASSIFRFIVISTPASGAATVQPYAIKWQAAIPNPPVTNPPVPNQPKPNQPPPPLVDLFDPEA